MAERFLSLDRSKRREILEGLAAELGRSASVLEKDVWVCWALGELFAMPNRLTMAFKGGTSLSKVFNAVQRFSEDIDITIDYSSLDPKAEPFGAGVTRSKLKTLSENLKEQLKQNLENAVVPYLRERLADATTEAGASVEFDGAEAVSVRYPSALEDATLYIPESVLLEFGGRNTTEPHELHEIAPDIASRLPTLIFPIARPEVLSPFRTFWEKATLIHVECSRPARRASVQRKSRHWYDLNLLADHSIGRTALLRRDLLHDVIKHKKVFFHSATTNYDECAAGGLKLVPEGALLDELKNDFSEMQSAGMFYADPPSFEQILTRLRILTEEINAVGGSSRS